MAFAIDCAKANTTPEINECAHAEQQKVEQKLNATYQAALNFLDQMDPLVKDDAVKAKAKLIEAERAWIKFREADCDAVFSLNASGTIRTVLRIGCMKSHAQSRIQDLENLMNGAGG